MKRKKQPRFTMQVFFIGIVVFEMACTIGISYGLVWMLHRWTDFSYDIPDIVWLLVFSLLLGCALSSAMGKRFFEPIARLRESMRQVAEGDFSVQLDDSKCFKEIRQINADFNRMVKELEATEILQTDFVSNVSHEFKTPINAIEGYATLLQGGEQPLTKEQTECVEEILDNTRRLSSLIGNMLLLSKVDNQSIQMQRTKYQLDEQIREAILSLERRWTEKKTEFDADMDAVEYTGNEKLMFHVWSNLIENAIKFGPYAGLIRIRLKKELDRIVFQIEDEGPGIEENAKKHIFDRFYQSDSSHKEEGNGLGLALVKQIVHLENGEIYVENRPEGGSCFTVVLRA